MKLSKRHTGQGATILSSTSKNAFRRSIKRSHIKKQDAKLEKLKKQTKFIQKNLPKIKKVANKGLEKLIKKGLKLGPLGSAIPKIVEDIRRGGPATKA